MPSGCQPAIFSHWSILLFCGALCPIDIYPLESMQMAHTIQDQLFYDTALAVYRDDHGCDYGDDVRGAVPSRLWVLGVPYRGLPEKASGTVSHVCNASGRAGKIPSAILVIFCQVPNFRQDYAKAATTAGFLCPFFC